MPLGLSKNLSQRIVSALLLLPPVLGSVYFGGWWFAFLLMVGGALMAIEWVSLTSVGDRPVGYVLAFLMILLVAWVQTANPDFQLLLVLLFGAAVLGGLLVKVTPLKKVGWFVSGVAYVAMPLVALWWLRSIEGLLVLWVLLIVWATDVGGYFAGKGIGGPKLAPKISPKKTWAGLIGGMGLSVAAGYVLYLIAPFGLSVVLLLLFSAVFAIWSQVGDLLESGVKRSFGVKDSGGLIPGHGGLLDRVDGLVFVAPAVAASVLIAPHLYQVAL